MHTQVLITLGSASVSCPRTFSLQVQLTWTFICARHNLKLAQNDDQPVWCCVGWHTHKNIHHNLFLPDINTCNNIMKEAEMYSFPLEILNCLLWCPHIVCFIALGHNWQRLHLCCGNLQFTSSRWSQDSWRCIVIREFAEYFGRCPWGATCLINSTCKSAGQLKLDQSALASWCWLIAELQNFEWAEVSMLFFLFQEENESLSCFHCLCLLGFRFSCLISLSAFLFFSLYPCPAFFPTRCLYLYLWGYCFLTLNCIDSLHSPSVTCFFPFTILHVFYIFSYFLPQSVSLSVLIRSALRGGWSVALFLHCLMFATMTPLMTSCSVIQGWSNKRKVTKKITVLTLMLMFVWNSVFSLSDFYWYFWKALSVINYFGLKNTCFALRITFHRYMAAQFKDSAIKKK